MKGKLRPATLLLGLLSAVTIGAPSVRPQPIAPEVSQVFTIVKNGGFERGDSQPAFWHRYPAEPHGWGRHRRDTECVHSGNASGLLISTAAHPDGKAGVQFNRYGIRVHDDADLIVSFFTRTDCGRPAGAGCHFYGEDHNHLGFVPVRVAGPAEDWTYVRKRVAVPDGATEMGFALYGRDEARTWFDDVSLLTVPRITAQTCTPTIDGILDDECWSVDSALDDFVLHKGVGLPAHEPKAWVGCDDDAIYVAFRCPHSGKKPLRLRAKERDGRTWLDDSVEIFLDPKPEQSGYFQFCVNADGVLRDSRVTRTDWESEARVRCHKRENRWTVEIAIPYDNLGIDMDTRNVWGLNLVYNNEVDSETLTWSLGGFHEPARFGRATITADFTRFCLPDLARRINDHRESISTLRNRMAEVTISTDAVADAHQLLAKAQRLLDELDDVVDAGLQKARGEWGGVHDKLKSVSNLLTGARRRAVEGLFAVTTDGRDAPFRVAIAHSLQKIRRAGEVRAGMLADSVKLHAARDESESFQLVIIPQGDALKDVSVQPSALNGDNGSIPVVWHRVGYVETAPPKYEPRYVGWWPDPLLSPAPFDVQKKHRQPIWLTVNVPPDAEPGEYSGQVEITCGGQSVSVPVHLRVHSFRIPRPGTLATPFGLYAFALSRWWWGEKPYRDHMPIEMFARWCEFMGKYRLTPKNMARAYVTHTGTGDDFSVDLTPLEKTVKPLAPKYFAPFSFCMHRLPTARQIGGSGSAGNAEVAANVVDTFADEWEHQGLPRDVYIYGYDEPHGDDYEFIQQAYSAVNAAAPQYPIMQTLGDPNPDELAGYVDIWCPLTPAADSEFYQRRKEAGETLWAYVCCGPRPPHANFFVDEPAIDHRVLFWQLHEIGATGLLYWCVCWWRGLPSPATAERHFPQVPIHLEQAGSFKTHGVNGDGLLIYPGNDHNPLPSMRLEIIRDGIEDYEYLQLLDRLVQRAAKLPAEQRPADELLKRARRLGEVPDDISHSMTDYTKTPGHIFRRRLQIIQVIDKLRAAVEGP